MSTESGLSQMELGNLVEGWSQSLVSLTERGLRGTLYDIRKLLAFADAVGMPRAALLADSAGDSAQRAYLYANMVQQGTCLARYTGRQDYAREALRFADCATEAARYEPSPVRTKFVSHSEITGYGDGESAARRACPGRPALPRGPRRHCPVPS